MQGPQTSKSRATIFAQMGCRRASFFRNCSLARSGTTFFSALNKTRVNFMRPWLVAKSSASAMFASRPLRMPKRSKRCRSSELREPLYPYVAPSASNCATLRGWASAETSSASSNTMCSAAVQPLTSSACGDAPSRSRRASALACSTPLLSYAGFSAGNPGARNQWSQSTWAAASGNAAVYLSRSIGGSVWPYARSSKYAFRNGPKAPSPPARRSK
mmetsp:Transcript_95640/g.160668  ORF Transcript_95640/g.160668 Transcript_95640/m.160668 type:complete len:216 (-) Transcript_95640:1219-1866(-)